MQMQKRNVFERAAFVWVCKVCVIYYLSDFFTAYIHEAKETVFNDLYKLVIRGAVERGGGDQVLVIQK